MCILNIIGISVCTDIIILSVCTEYISVYSERIMSIQFVMCIHTYNYTSVISCSDWCKRAYTLSIISVTGA